MPRSAPASLGFAWLINRLIYGCYRYGCEEFEMFIYIVLLYHVIWPDDYLTLDTWYLTPILDMLSLGTWYLISDTGTWHVILDTWYLTLDIWHRYLTCYHLHLIPDTWYMTLDNWHAITYLTCYHLVLVHLTDIVTPDWILLHLTLYYFAHSWLSLLRGLDMIIILLRDIWYF